MQVLDPKQLYRVKVRIYNIPEPNRPTPSGQFQAFFTVDAPLDNFGLPDLSYWLTKKEIEVSERRMLETFNNPRSAFRSYGQAVYEVRPRYITRRNIAVEREIDRAQAQVESDRRESELFRQNLDRRLNRLSEDERLTEILEREIGRGTSEEQLRTQQELVSRTRDRLEQLRGIELDNENIERLNSELERLRSEIEDLSRRTMEAVRVGEEVAPEASEGIASGGVIVRSEPKYGVKIIPRELLGTVRIEDVVVGASNVVPLKIIGPEGAFLERLMVIKESAIQYDSGELSRTLENQSYIITQNDEDRWERGE